MTAGGPVGHRCGLPAIIDGLRRLGLTLTDGSAWANCNVDAGGAGSFLQHLVARRNNVTEQLECRGGMTVGFGFSMPLFVMGRP